VKNRLFKIRDLIGYRHHAFKCHVRGTLDRRERSRAMLAEQVASVRCFQIQADRRIRKNRCESVRESEILFATRLFGHIESLARGL